MSVKQLTQGEHLDQVIDAEYVAPSPLKFSKDFSTEATLQTLLDQRTVELAQARAKIAQLEKANALAVGMLKKQLLPWKKIIDAIWGQIDQFDLGNEGSGLSEKWAAVKPTLAPRMQQAIDLLLLQGSMTRREIAAALRMNYTNCVTNVIGAMLRQGWFVESNGKIQLKEL